MNRVFLGILISIVTQTHKPFYDLTMETRGVPGGVAALTRSRKSTPRVSLRKQRSSLPQAFRMVWKLCLQFPWEHETPPVTDPLADLWHWAGATGMELFQHNWNNEGWDKKAPYGLGPLNKLSGELAQWDRENAACPFVSQILSLLGWLPDRSHYLHLLVGGGQREHSQIGQKPKLSRLRTRWK